MLASTDGHFRARATRQICAFLPPPGAAYHPSAEVHLETTTTSTRRTADAMNQTREIVLIDDNQTVTSALSNLLEKAGYSVAAFDSGLAALRHAAEARPDAAVIDIHLPDINGLVLTQRLRDELGERIPIIILSGDTSMETINSLPHVGATYFFPKPVQGAQLIERLKEWMD